MNNKVYMIIDISVKDHKMYGEYVEKARPIVLSHGGRYLAKCDNVISLSGNWNPERMVIIEFDNLSLLQQCFNSSEYKEICYLREQSTEGKAVVVQS